MKKYKFKDKVSSRIDEFNKLQLSYNLSVQGRFDEALLELLDVFQYQDRLSHQTLVYINLALGNIYYLQQRYDEAVEHYEELCRLDSLNTMGYVNMGNCFLNMRKFNESLAQFKIAFDIEPEFVPVHMGLGRVFMKRCRYDTAITYFNKVLSLDPEEVAAHILLAQIYREQAKFRHSLEHLEAALKIKPKMLLGYIWLGHIYLALKELALAEQAFKTALKLNPLSVDAKRGLADVLIAMTKFQDAIDLMDEIPQLSELASNKAELKGLELALVSQHYRFDESCFLDLWMYSCALEKQVEFLSA